MSRKFLKGKAHLMIALISGKIVHKGISHVVVDVQGVGYRVFIPLTTFYELPDAGQMITLHVHTNVKQDAINLFGFYTDQERDLFQLMISVSGIGPKVAMNILSGISARELLSAISGGNVGKLVNIPGVGKKMAERLILELKEKVIKKMMSDTTAEAGLQSSASDIIMDDVLSALVNLGYKSNVAREALDKVLRSSEEELGMDKLLKKTLKIIAG
jgi:Holliday junction DNA helicase RuvA